MNRSKTQHSRPNTVRIIAGQWRGRKLPVANISGLRPTGDRIRETLFNWLEPEIGGARCLDLFTGSGALALEALSRGAAAVIAVDSHKDAVGSLRELQKLLSAEGLQLIHSDAQSWLAAHREEQFDIVFLDPPFQLGLLSETAQLLEQANCLATEALIYIERDIDQATAELPSNWQPYREKTAGKVHYALYRRKS